MTVIFVSQVHQNYNHFFNTGAEQARPHFIEINESNYE